MLWRSTLRCMDQAIAQGAAPGFVAGVWLAADPKEPYLVSRGHRRKEPSAQPMETETIFDLASLTKPIATSSLAAQLVDRGELGWDTPLSRLIPGYPHSGIEIRHLLSHTSGLPAWKPFYERLKERLGTSELWRKRISKRQQAMREEVFSASPEHPPEKQEDYSDLGALLVGFALEELGQDSLDNLARRYLFEPMGLRGLGFRRVTRDPSSDRWEVAAATENCPWRGAVLQGQVHDDNAWAMGGFGGHAGLFGTAGDVLGFARALILESEISKKTLYQMWSEVPSPAHSRRTLGWDMPSGSEPALGSQFSKNSVGHLGFTGTSFWIDLDRELAVVLLSNRVHPSRDGTEKFKPWRARIHDAIYDDLLSAGLVR